eukprot:gene17536-19286_t
MADNIITQAQETEASNRKVKEVIHLEEGLLEDLENDDNNNSEEGSCEEDDDKGEATGGAFQEDKEEHRNGLKKRLKNWISKKDDDNHSLTAFGFGNADNDQWGSMGPLGIYGLLTPAIAAVPASDEFDTIHKQVRAQLGENWEIQLAAAHVDDALTGRGKYGKARSYFKKKSAQRCFKILENIWYRRFFLFISLAHSLMIFMEPPSYAVTNIHAAVFVAGAVCILVYMFDLALRVRFLSWSVFWSLETEERYWNGVQFVLVFLFWIDLLLLCISAGLKTYIPQPFRCLRLAMLLCRLKSIRHVFEVLIIISHNLIKVLFIILIFIITFASIGIHLYMTTYNTTFNKTGVNATSSCCVSTDEGSESTYIGAFDNLGTAMLRLFVLLSTENYPEIMLPALRKDKSNFFFFGVYVFFGGFFLTAILLAIVVDTYWIFAKKTVRRERASERAELAKAWNLLDPLGLGALAVTDKQFLQLFRILKPKNTDEQNLILIELLDTQGDGEIDSFEWTTTLRQALHAEFEKDIGFPEEEENSKIISRIRKHTRAFTESAIFSRVILCLILFHGGKARRQIRNWESMFETTIRIVGLGKGVIHVLELTDVALVSFAVVFNFLWYIKEASAAFKHACVIISSVSVICRWMLNSSGSRKAFRWILNIVPVMFDLVALLFVILYLLSTIAMELFYSYDAPSNDQIYPNECGLGFKNFWCSFLVMFQVLTTSNWHEIMNLTESVVRNQVAYFFFPVSYLITTMIVMNLFVAIAIEAANKLTRNDPKSPTHRTTDEELQIQQQPKSFNQNVKKAFTNMAKSVFGSARVDEQKKRRHISPNASSITLTGKRKGSATIILSSPSKKDPNRNSSGSNRRKVVSKESESEGEVESDINEDYTGLSPEEKRKKQLKNRMKKKRKARQKKRRTSAEVLDRIQKQVRAIASFRGSQSTDLDLVVGDTITIVATRDEWMQGKCKGATGWFPASHVINWTAKARIASATRKSITSIAQNNVTDVANTSTTKDKYRQAAPKEKTIATDGSATTKEDISLGTKNTGNTSTGLLAPQPNYRIKMKKSGDWRRDILGDMTVMNAEEMRALNKVMRAELRGPRSKGPRASGLAAATVEEAPQRINISESSQARPTESTLDSLRVQKSSTGACNDEFVPPESPSVARNRPIVSENSLESVNVARIAIQGVENAKPVAPMATIKCPTVSVSQMSTFEFTLENEPTAAKDDQEVGSKDLLEVDQADEGRDGKQTKAKPEKGGIPDWAKKFVEDKNINMHNDVKFSETTFNDGGRDLPGTVHTLEDE